MPIYDPEEGREAASHFEALQNRGQNEFKGLETFDLSGTISHVSMTSTEFTALCPVTGQPDFYAVEIKFWDSKKGIESKSLKLYLQQFRDKGAFCEALADEILGDVYGALGGETIIEVTLVQKSRGGISITAEARNA